MNEISQMLNDGALLCAGSIDNFNTMTINWGMLGTIYRKDTFVCFVRPSSYTNKFVEENDYFTVSFYYPRYRQQLSYLGTHSGRESNKVLEVGFTPVEVENGVTFKEAYLTFVCKKIYHTDMEKSNLNQEIQNVYYASNDVHKIYFGEIVKIIEDENLD